jgi:hypothetical protein
MVILTFHPKSLEDGLRVRVIFGKKIMEADSRCEAVGFKSWLVGEQTLISHAPF